MTKVSNQNFLFATKTLWVTQSNKSEILGKTRCGKRNIKTMMIMALSIDGQKFTCTYLFCTCY